jgi:hypothetical protein
MSKAGFCDFYPACFVVKAVGGKPKKQEGGKKNQALGFQSARYASLK